MVLKKLSQKGSSPGKIISDDIIIFEITVFMMNLGGIFVIHEFYHNRFKFS